MKALNLSKQSLHYRLATKYASFENEYKLNEDTGEWETLPTDLCTYMRKVFLGIGLAMLWSATGGIFAACIADAVIYVYIQIFIGDCGPIDGLGTIGGAIFGVVFLGLFLYVCDKIHDHYQDKRWAKQLAATEAAQNQPPTPPKPDNFWSKAFKSIKEKTCYKVELT